MHRFQSGQIVRPRKKHLDIAGIYEILRQLPSAVETGIVAVGIGHRRLEVVVHGNPVRQALARAGLGIGVVGGAHRGDEELPGMRFAGERIEDVDGVAGKIDKHLLAAHVGLAHGRADAPLLGRKGGAEPDGAGAIGMGDAIFLPEQPARHATAAQLLPDINPVGDRAMIG